MAPNRCEPVSGGGGRRRGGGGGLGGGGFVVGAQLSGVITEAASQGHCSPEVGREWREREGAIVGNVVGEGQAGEPLIF